MAAVRESSSFTVVRLDKPAELMFAADDPVGLRLECLVENFVVHAEASVWASRVVIGDPGGSDIVELVATEADEVVETFPFEGFDPRFRRSWRKQRAYLGERPPTHHRRSN